MARSLLLAAAALALCALPAALAQMVTSATPAACSSTLITSTKSSGRTSYVLDPWIVPSVNTTNGSLPPGVCPFPAYPTLNVTCRDTLTFISRAVPARMSVHGVYLLMDEFVNQDTGAYRCPSPATDIDLRTPSNDKAGNPIHNNFGACRGDTLVQVAYDNNATVFTPKFKASSDCAGYIMLDPLQLFNVNTTACGTATNRVEPANGCYDVDNYKAVFKKLVPKKTRKTLVFACPAIAGNQPGLPMTHCSAGMAIRVNVDCTKY